MELSSVLHANTYVYLHTHEDTHTGIHTSMLVRAHTHTCTLTDTHTLSFATLLMVQKDPTSNTHRTHYSSPYCLFLCYTDSTRGLGNTAHKIKQIVAPWSSFSWKPETKDHVNRDSGHPSSPRRVQQQSRFLIQSRMERRMS